MADKHTKRCSTSLVIREQQIKTTPRHHNTPTRVGKIEKTKDNHRFRENAEWLELPAAPRKTVWQRLRKLNHT